jgi:membrane protease YdiL (CAAX protease family)
MSWLARIGGYSAAAWAMMLLAACLTLLPLLVLGFGGERAQAWAQALARRPSKPATWARLGAPAVLAVPYLLVACACGDFHLRWLALYLLLPVVVAALLEDARRADPQQRGSWRELLVLAGLGLAVDLRWLEGAWPPHLAVFSKLLLLDAGMYGFLVVRHLNGVGFDLRLRRRDLSVGGREYAFYAPIAILLGLGLGFLHFHARLPSPAEAAGAFGFTFLFIAVPEELFFRGWMQNLLERRLGRIPALISTSVLFGLSHFNKRALHFNWRYVLMAALAGIFYGRAWRRERRVGASVLTHALVDSTWSLWLR